MRSRKSPDLPPDTRKRVLGVAREMIAGQGSAAISLVDVAAKAGVSRQTLYLLFGNRAGMLLAMVNDIDQGSSSPGKLAAIRERMDARDALEAYVRTWLEYVPEVLPVALALSAAATAGDADARAAWDSRMKLLRNGFAQITARLKRAGALREGWTPQAAADWIYGQTHVDAWHHLVDECGWPPNAVVERIVSTIRDALVRKPQG